MVTGATSLSLVRDELFATMEEAEQGLEHFIIDRNNGSLLQQAVENLKQVRGTLKLIELTGAELLAQEILQLATDIPVGAGEERDTQLAALSNALYVLGRYLESVDASRQEMPELLLPPINALRLVSAQSPLAESFFFSARLDHARPPVVAAVREPAARMTEARRLRQMYQVGLLGFIREDNAPASLKLMARALSRLDLLFANTSAGRLCWLGGGGVGGPAGWPAATASITQATVFQARPGASANQQHRGVRASACPAQGIAISGCAGGEQRAHGHSGSGDILAWPAALYRSSARGRVPAPRRARPGSDALAVIGHS